MSETYMITAYRKTPSWRKELSGLAKRAVWPGEKIRFRVAALVLDFAYVLAIIVVIFLPKNPFQARQTRRERLNPTMSDA